MEESIMHAGRSYGGCTILYKSSCTEMYLVDLKRTCGIEWKLNNYDGLVNLITDYMHCDDNIAMHHHDFNYVFICTVYNIMLHFCIIGGYFNTDISRVNSICNILILLLINLTFEFKVLTEETMQ